MTPLHNISNINQEGSSFTATVTFDPSHPVFAGHFPGQPIVPGVYLLEILGDVISKVSGRRATIQQATVIKFIRVIDPAATASVTYSGTIIPGNDGFRIDAVIRQGEEIFAKFKGIRIMLV